MSGISEPLKITTPTDRDVVITRAFNAPRDLVYDCYTKPELVKRWLGVHNGFTLEVCEIDLRVGGAYRYVWRGPGGFEMGMGGMTTSTLTVQYESKEARDIVLKSPMDQGMEAGYKILDGLLASLTGAAAGMGA